MGKNALGLQDLVAAMPNAAAVLNRSGVLVVANETWQSVTDAMSSLVADHRSIEHVVNLDASVSTAISSTTLVDLVCQWIGSGASFQSVLNGHVTESVEHLDYSVVGESATRQLELRMVSIGSESDYVLATCTDSAVECEKAVEPAESTRRVDRHPLTGLPGRNLLLELLSQAMTMSDRHRYHPAVLSIALQGLGEIELRHGVEARDELVMAVSSRLKAGLRPGDVVAHITDDQFAVMLPDVYGEDLAEAVAHRVSVEVTRPFRLGDTRADVGVFIGVASSEALGSATSVLAESEISMARALSDEPSITGESPHRRVVVAGATDIQAAGGSETRRINVADLREEELVSYFQPVFDVTDRTVVAGEALMRWRHPHYGVLSAGEFLGLAINHGLLATLTDQALVRSAETWADIRDQLGETPPQLFVNLSPDQLLSRVAVERLHHLLVATGLPASEVVIEVTEEAMSTRFEEMLAVLNELRSNGLRVALDDFGSGYSSLGRLRHLPVDVIKVDQSMVRGLETDERARRLLGAVSTMVRELDVECIVEGIETLGEANIVADLGFRYVQGYHFAHPCPAEEFAQIVKPRTPIIGA